LFYVISGAFLGVEASNKFVRFVMERNREITAEDILTNWNKAKKRLAGKNTITNEQYVEACTKLNSFLNKKSAEVEMTLEQAEQYAKFMQDSPAEVMMTSWAHLSGQVANIIKVHKFVEKMLLGCMVDNADQKSFSLPTLEQARASSGGTTPAVATTPAAESDSAGGGVEKPKAKRGAKTKV
jgi:chemotaxis regulatin CheY-phosphate phosphatase CheZ